VYWVQRRTATIVYITFRGVGVLEIAYAQGGGQQVTPRRLERRDRTTYWSVICMGGRSFVGGMSSEILLVIQRRCVESLHQWTRWPSWNLESLPCLGQRSISTLSSMSDVVVVMATFWCLPCSSQAACVDWLVVARACFFLVFLYIIY
jgi:hypothetical protein